MLRRQIPFKRPQPTRTALLLDSPMPSHTAPVGKLLITAGPTHEPIDAVRYLGNRSSGRLGVALAHAAQAAGWETTLALGPTNLSPESPSTTLSPPRVLRFQTTQDLLELLQAEAPRCDALVMAAAVADYRPTRRLGPSEKLRRTKEGLRIELESTPDLLATVSADKRPDQVFVGFALEPRERLIESAASKLARKKVDAIVANPLETMDADKIEASFLTTEGVTSTTDGAIPKADFAPWLLTRVAALFPCAPERSGTASPERSGTASIEAG